MARSISMSDVQAKHESDMYMGYISLDRICIIIYVEIYYIHCISKVPSTFSSKNFTWKMYEHNHGR